VPLYLFISLLPCINKDQQKEEVTCGFAKFQVAAKLATIDIKSRPTKMQ